VNDDLKDARAITGDYLEPPLLIAAQLVINVAKAFRGNARGHFPSSLARRQFLTDFVAIRKSSPVERIEA
jgi:hypothetical protein